MISISRNNLKIAGVIWGISLAVFGSIYMFVIKPQNLTLDNYANKFQNIDPLNFESQKKELREQIDNIKVHLDDFVMTSKDIQNFATSEIYNIAENINIDPTSFHVKPWQDKEVNAFKKSKNVYGQLIEVTFNATFKEFAKFLNTLEMHEPYIFIDSFSITRSTDENDKHEVEMNLAVLVERNAAPKGV